MKLSTLILKTLLSLVRSYWVKIANKINSKIIKDENKSSSTLFLSKFKNYPNFKVLKLEKNLAL